MPAHGVLDKQTRRLRLGLDNEKQTSQPPTTHHELQFGGDFCYNEATDFIRPVGSLSSLDRQVFSEA